MDFLNTDTFLKGKAKIFFTTQHNTTIETTRQFILVVFFSDVIKLRLFSLKLMNFVASMMTVVEFHREVDGIQSSLNSIEFTLK